MRITCNVKYVKKNINRKFKLTDTQKTEAVAH